jgi:Ca2+-binding EF-hand superfamily protein
MKALLVTVALGAAAFSTSVLAQAPAQPQPQAQAQAQSQAGGRGGWMQRDQTRDQAKQMADMLFKRLDANGDGTVTRAEAEQVAQQFGGGDDSNGGRGGGRIAMMINRAFGDAQSMTLAQFAAQALARFDAIDLNHDGTLSVAERQQARAQRQAQQTPGQ